MNRLQKRNKRRKIFWTVIVVFIACFFIYQLIMAPVKFEDLKKNKIITIGVVTGTSNNQRNTGSGVNYIFYINSKKHSGSSAYSNLSTTFCESLVGKSFPVIYSSKHINNNEMLLTKQSFEMYEMQQPDSMKWIEDYIQ